jgi:hypothetical protein
MNAREGDSGYEPFSPFVGMARGRFMASPNVSWRLTVFAAVALACMAAMGCGSHKQSQPRQQSGLKKLALVYGRFLSQHRGKPPADEAEFKKYVGSLRPAELKSFGVNDPSQIFVSERDGKPYVIIYGPPKGPPGPGSSPVIAYEQEGKGGNRWVASAAGAVEEVDEARFRELVPTAKQ